jgi:hypothetical protein
MVTPITPKNFRLEKSSWKRSTAPTVTAEIEEALIALIYPTFGAVRIPTCIK